MCSFELLHFLVKYLEIVWPHLLALRQTTFQQDIFTEQFCEKISRFFFFAFFCIFLWTIIPNQFVLNLALNKLGRLCDCVL